MSPYAQRIAIAEACGWTGIRMSNRWEYSDDPSKPQDWSGLSPAPHIYGHIPDYPYDLNAMHEAEKVIHGALDQNKYVAQIRIITDPMSLDSYSQDFLIIHATAAQRAEAFLRTIGKWDDSK